MHNEVKGCGYNWFYIQQQGDNNSSQKLEKKNKSGKESTQSAWIHSWRFIRGSFNTPSQENNVIAATLQGNKGKRRLT